MLNRSINQSILVPCTCTKLQFCVCIFNHRLRYRAALL